MTPIEQLIAAVNSHIAWSEDCHDKNLVKCVEAAEEWQRGKKPEEIVRGGELVLRCDCGFTVSKYGFYNFCPNCGIPIAKE